MHQTLRKSGGSLVLTIPKAFIEQHGLQADDEVELTFFADSIQITPAATTKPRSFILSNESRNKLTHKICFEGGVQIQISLNTDLETFCDALNYASLIIDKDVQTIIQTDHINCVIPIRMEKPATHVVTFVGSDAEKITLDFDKLTNIPRFAFDDNIKGSLRTRRLELIGDLIIAPNKITSISPTLEKISRKLAIDSQQPKS